jgi:hypothetical protein
MAQITISIIFFDLAIRMYRNTDKGSSIPKPCRFARFACPKNCPAHDRCGWHAADGLHSKYLNTLYVDKGVKYHGLIQGFSKAIACWMMTPNPYGNITNFSTAAKH